MTSSYTVVISGTPALDMWGELPDGRLWGEWRWVDCSPQTYQAIEFFQALPATLITDTGEVVESSHPYLRKGDILKLVPA
ncbi:MAG TPA: hypothetical protein VH541_05645 [Gaiellaceae bacterium]|jgi:hypothetical protein